jgi:hypothetical protein
LRFSICADIKRGFCSENRLGCGVWKFAGGGNMSMSEEAQNGSIVRSLVVDWKKVLLVFGESGVVREMR